MVRPFIFCICLFFFYFIVCNNIYLLCWFHARRILYTKAIPILGFVVIQSWKLLAIFILLYSGNPEYVCSQIEFFYSFYCCCCVCVYHVHLVRLAVWCYSWKKAATGTVVLFFILVFSSLLLNLLNSFRYIYMYHILKIHYPLCWVGKQPAATRKSNQIYAVYILVYTEEHSGGDAISFYFIKKKQKKNCTLDCLLDRRPFVWCVHNIIYNNRLKSVFCVYCAWRTQLSIKIK